MQNFMQNIWRKINLLSYPFKNTQIFPTSFCTYRDTDQWLHLLMIILGQECGFQDFRTWLEKI